MKLLKDDLWRLNHILDAIANVERCLGDTQSDPVLVQAALERFTANIGEMCRGVSAALQNAYPQIPWADVIAMRNMLVHEYHKINQETVWHVAEHKIPALKDWVKGIIEANHA